MAVTASGKDKLLKDARIYVGGYDLSGDALSVSSLDFAYGSADVTGWSESVRNFISSSRVTTGIQGFQALMNDSTGQAWDRLKNDVDRDTQLTFGFGGGGSPAVGDPAYHLPSIAMDDVMSMTGNRAVLATSFLFDSSQYTGNFIKPLGVILRGDTSLGATLTASSTNSVDFEAIQSGNTGWTAIIHILATSSGNFAITVKDSSDDSSFSTIGTFTTTGGSVGAELISGTDTVERYVAFDAQRTAGSITAIVSFVRN